MRLHNTLSGQVEELTPVVPGHIGIYVCGVTPYDVAHVGHAMSLIVYDVLVRYLRWRGLQVTFVSNYTDVDDKLIERGAALGRDPLELASANIEVWEDEQRQLGLLAPDVRPRVTGEIPSIIAMIEEIVANGYGYATPGGDVYYRVRAKADYGKLSHRNIEDLRTGTRFEPGEEKEFPLDFALWKAAKPGEPAWDSPWGRGRPGWHIECSAMSRRYLYTPEGGERFDIHGGGIDLVFPHHENEIAQAEAAASGPGQVFARLWMHNGMVQRDGEKMSKSIGNVVTVAEALQRWSPDAIRLFVLTSHYRSRNNLTDEAMAAASAGVERLTNALRDVPEPTEALSPVQRSDALQAISGRLAATRTSDSGGPVDASFTMIDSSLGSVDSLVVGHVADRFVDAMEDDLGTPRAVAALFGLASAINVANMHGVSTRDARDRLRELAGVLGLALDEGAHAGGERTDAAEIEQLLAERAAARSAKNFARADAIRAELDAAGIVIEDTPQGARWSVKR